MDQDYQDRWVLGLAPQDSVDRVRQDRWVSGVGLQDSVDLARRDSVDPEDQVSQACPVV